MKKIVIYQSNDSNITFRNYAANADKFKKGIILEEHGYKKVYEEEKYLLDDMNNAEILDHLFYLFNKDDRPGKIQFRSISISDIIEIDGRAYFVDDFGFQKVQIQKKSRNRIKKGREID